MVVDFRHPRRLYILFKLITSAGDAPCSRYRHPWLTSTRSKDSKTSLIIQMSPDNSRFGTSILEWCFSPVMCSREWVSLCSYRPNWTSLSAEPVDDVIGFGPTSPFLSTRPAVGDVTASRLNSVPWSEGLAVGDDKVTEKTAGHFECNGDRLCITSLKELE